MADLERTDRSAREDFWDLPLWDLPEEDFDTVEEVDAVFRAQRRLSFTYGAIFLAVTVSIPLLTVTSGSWMGRVIWGGVTINYLVVSFLYQAFYIILGLAYTLQADKLEEELLGRRNPP